MKFEQYPVTYDKDGFGFAKPDIMVGSNEESCIMCGAPTRYVETLSEGHFCSDECVDRFYKELVEPGFLSYLEDTTEN